MKEDARPAAAIGHMFLRADGVAKTSARLIEVGLRPIIQKEHFAIFELRGGTHVVIRPLEDKEEHFEASFDLMVDDIQAAHTQYRAAGFEVSAVESGRIHESFQAKAPERFSFTVLDSHAKERVV